MNREALLLSLQSILAEETGKTLYDLDESQTFHSLGLDSISIIVVLDALEHKYKLTITPLDFWDHPTLGSFVDFLISEQEKKS